MSGSPTPSIYSELPLLRSLLLSLITLAVSGCLYNTTTRIEGDGKAFQPAIRASLNLDRERVPATEMRSGTAIEVSYQRNSVTSEQILPAGANPVVFADTTFSSPNQLTNQFNFAYSNALLRSRIFYGDHPLGLEIAGGIGAARMGITISSQAQRASHEFSEEGIDIGIGVIWRLARHSSLYANYGNFSSPDISAERYGAYYLGAIANHLALRAGYNYWEISGVSGRAMSEYRLKYSGPSLALELAF